ncbi:MAG TPA: radical SAM protein [Armatimonadota bacterium]|jgi:tRNA A37 methylthiotransferase MiaB
MMRVDGTTTGQRVHLWQNLMCLSYLMELKKMEDFFQANGCQVVDAPEEADWVIVGACAAFHNQIDDFFTKLDELTSLPAQVAVYGCVPKVATERYAEVNSRVAFFMDTKSPHLVERVVPDCRVKWNQIPDADGFRMVDYRKYDPTKKYVIIQHGCNAKCVFCPHSKGIGPQQSLSRERVLGNIRRSLTDGARSILLEGRDAGSWGTDLQPAETFPDLLQSILAIDQDFKLLLNQLGANWVIRYQDALLDLLLDRRVVDVHIPIQTSSNRLLKVMGREPGVRELQPFMEALRERTDRPILRTDVMIGFPTETEEEFKDTMAFVNEYFDEVACYGFELHQNTEVAQMGLPFHEHAVIEDRVQRALAMIKNNPRMVWHRGGQVPSTMLDREKHKEKLNRM